MTRTEDITLFTGILPEEIEKMGVCFQTREINFKSGETIMAYSTTMVKVGVVLEGQAVLCCSESDGTEYLIEELFKDSVFGEPFLLPADSRHYYIMARTAVRVLFIDYQHVIKRCPNACHHHSQLVSNLLQLMAHKSGHQTDRIYLLSRSTTRKKLLAYLTSLASEKGSSCFTLPMSYTDLALYLSVDRSAMMRELKNLCDQNILTKNGRSIQLTDPDADQNNP